MPLLLAIIAAWTNTANRVIVAEPVKLDGAAVVMRVSGGERKLPLSVFPESEQRRIKAALETYELPAALEELRRTFAADLLRAEQRHAGGVLTDEEFADKAGRIYGGWARALEKSALTPEEREFWKGQIK